MQKIFKKLYFFTKLSTSFLLLLIVLFLIFVFVENYLNQEIEKNENFENKFDQINKQININNISVNKLVAKIDNFETELQNINEKLIIINSDQLKDEIEILANEIDNMSKTQKQKKFINNNKSNNNINRNEKIIIEEYIKTITFNIENGLKFKKIIQNLEPLIKKESSKARLEKLLLSSNGEILSYDELIYNFNQLNNIFLKEYLLNRSNNFVLTKFFLNFFSLKADKKSQSTDSIINSLSISSDYLVNKEIGNAIEEISKIEYNSKIFHEWISDALKYKEAKELIFQIKEDL